MESFSFQSPATGQILQRAHVGVVGSGDLEILIEQGTEQETIFEIRTASDGFRDIWEAVFNRFAAHHNIAVKITINDFGATPGVVNLRLSQALEVANKNHNQTKN